MEYLILLYIYIFIIGCVLGSFYNVCIYRIPIKKSVVLGRSACMTCGKTLGWSEMIPILSYMFLRGRCKKCKTPFSIRYALVEGLCGLLFLSSFIIYGLSIQAIIVCAFFSVMVISCFIYYDTGKIYIQAAFIIGLLSLIMLLMELKLIVLFWGILGSVCLTIPVLLTEFITHKVNKNKIIFVSCLGLFLGLHASVVLILVSICIHIVTKICRIDKPTFALGFLFGSVIGMITRSPILFQ